ncbi:hypothetical protein HanPSC8_Chr01g0008841 [Helianthus annuus]|nr:hypothetical protein HanPSC8_Chr01g0008841 [Helianthus annuus]
MFADLIFEFMVIISDLLWVIWPDGLEFREMVIKMSLNAWSLHEEGVVVVAEMVMKMLKDF